MAVSGQEDSIFAICRQHVLHEKWLVAPSIRIANQWLENSVRGSRGIINLRPTTLFRFALNLVAPQFSRQGITLAAASNGALIVDAIWDQLATDGYLASIPRSPGTDFSAAVYRSLAALRLAGLTVEDVQTSAFETPVKGRDLMALLDNYRKFLATHNLVDEADVLRMAADQLQTAPETIDPRTLVLIPAQLQTSRLERQLLHGIPDRCKRTFHDPSRWLTPDGKPRKGPAAAGPSQEESDGKVDAQPTESDDRLEGCPTKPTTDRLEAYPTKPTTDVFRAVGEVNEVREVLRRCLAAGTPLDDVELLHTDSGTYVPLLYATARRFATESESRTTDGLAVTFAEGIPASISRPGRALTAWLRWIDQHYPQQLLVEMIGDGLLNCDPQELSFGYLARLLRPIAIGLHAPNYVPKLNEQIDAIRRKMLDHSTRQITSQQDPSQPSPLERKLAGLTALRRMIQQLIALSSEVISHSNASALSAASNFLRKHARSLSELDRYSAESLLQHIEDRRVWLARIQTVVDVRKWLAGLPAETRVMGSGPQPGHLHVAQLTSGGHSGRARTFIVGLDDYRFPGAPLQDPILLDRERAAISDELSTSGDRVRQQLDRLAAALTRAGSRVTLSWSCRDLQQDRDVFPSAAVLSACRSATGNHQLDLRGLETLVGPPVSFAPSAAEKAMDESERWLWWLTDQRWPGADFSGLVLQRFAHLRRGSLARQQRTLSFGNYNGYVPLAGTYLNPFAANSPVLSASALETAGRCPLAFFFRNALKISPLTEQQLDPDRWLDAAQFGLLLHDVFRGFMAALQQAGQRPEFERDHKRLAEHLERAVQSWRTEIPPINENAFRLQSWQLVRTAAIFLQDEESHCRTSQPRFFEVALGLPPVGNGTPLDESNPSIVGLADGKRIRVRGQIDRVDQLDEHRFALWDYKISSGYGYNAGEPFRQGRRVQSVLYLRMIESALRAKLDPQAIVEQFGYFFPSLRAMGMRINWDAATLDDGLRILERMCDGIAAGAFVATDDKDDCRFCDYAKICNPDRDTCHSQHLLQQDELVSLQPFRELRRD